MAFFSVSVKTSVTWLLPVCTETANPFPPVVSGAAHELQMKSEDWKSDALGDL